METPSVKNKYIGESEYLDISKKDTDRYDPSYINTMQKQIYNKST